MQQTKNSHQIREELRKSSLFGCFDQDQFEELCRHVRVVHLDKGDVLFNQGEEAHSFYFVFSGMIKLYRLSVDGNEKIFELEAEGSTFAEALMFNEPSLYPVSASALQESTLLEINNQNFRHILSQSFKTSLMIMGDLSKRLHGLINEIDNLSLMTGRNRIATYMLEQALINGREFTLKIPKNAIASILSLQPETFSRLIKELCMKKVIEVRDSHIKVLDMSALRKNAGIA
jgi:CRP/FNR family transcriptional regulator, dissimilatory nitrate respiration regulator